MKPIIIKMLGKFDIISENESAAGAFGNTTKSAMFIKYLILNKGKAIPTSELINTFWSDEHKTNPENALKTMVSRIRKSLSKAAPHLRHCIVTERGSYKWNIHIPCEVDVFLFEQLCGEVLEVNEFSPELQKKYDTILTLYNGDLVTGDLEEDYLTSYSFYLHNLYLDVVYHYLDILEQVREYDLIIQVSRLALNIDAFDQKLHIALMTALKDSGKSHLALTQYRHVKDLYYKYMSDEPPRQLTDFYKTLTQNDSTTETDLKAIRQRLQKTDTSSGAYVCDYSIFEDIYHIQLRNLERWNVKMYLMLLSIENILQEPFEPLVLDGLMRDMHEMLRSSLRKSDVITQYSPTQYALLLISTDQTNIDSIIDRIKKYFYRDNLAPSLRISFQLESLTAEG
ncbi:MAG: AfsR/SARP family transcriptional regulator [Christensenellaceae bacterium]|jgi:DNA-binding SARP family transcriptional activator